MTEISLEFYDETFKGMTGTTSDDVYYGELKLAEEAEDVGKFDYNVLTATACTDDATSAALAGSFSFASNSYERNVLTDLSTKGKYLDDNGWSMEISENAWLFSDEVLSWTNSKIASYSLSQKLFRCVECGCVGQLSDVGEHWLGTHANIKIYQCSECGYASAWPRCLRMHLARQHSIYPDEESSFRSYCKENPALEDVTKYLERLKYSAENCRNDQPSRPEQERNCVYSIEPSSFSVISEFSGTPPMSDHHIAAGSVIAYDQREEPEDEQEPPSSTMLADGKIELTNDFDISTTGIVPDEDDILNRISERINDPDFLLNEDTVEASLKFAAENEEELIGKEEANGPKLLHELTDEPCPSTKPDPNESSSSLDTPVCITSNLVKRYDCAHCSYTTDRRDLFTRHENIHRVDKPYRCNVCQKQFNRADHIKKHFVRLHPDESYCLHNVRQPSYKKSKEPLNRSVASTDGQENGSPTAKRPRRRKPKDTPITTISIVAPPPPPPLSSSSSSSSSALADCAEQKDWAPATVGQPCQKLIQRATENVKATEEEVETMVRTITAQTMRTIYHANGQNDATVNSSDGKQTIKSSIGPNNVKLTAAASGIIFMESASALTANFAKTALVTSSAANSDARSSATQRTPALLKILSYSPTTAASSGASNGVNKIDTIRTSTATVAGGNYQTVIRVNSQQPAQQNATGNAILSGHQTPTTAASANPQNTTTIISSSSGTNTILPKFSAIQPRTNAIIEEQLQIKLSGDDLVLPKAKNSVLPMDDYVSPSTAAAAQQQSVIKINSAYLSKNSSQTISSAAENKVSSSVPTTSAANTVGKNTCTASTKIVFGPKLPPGRRPTSPDLDVYTCNICDWTGADKWSHRRHLNTHSKPFKCPLCDYKAARSERLQTHVNKVHRKIICMICKFTTEELNQLVQHQQTVHWNEGRKVKIPRKTKDELI